MYVQCGAGTVEESYAHIRASVDLGVDGAGLMTPVFFPTDDTSLESYFDTILDEITDFPVYAYNIPTHTGNDLSSKSLGKLMAAHDNLLGVKYSFTDVLQLEHYIDCCPSRHASVLVGNDALAITCMMLGGDGWVSGPSAVFPRRHVKLYKALKNGDYETARMLQYRILRTADAMSDIPEIPAIKYMLTRLGVIESDICRMPLRPLTNAEKVRLDVLLDDSLKED